MPSVLKRWCSVPIVTLQCSSPSLALPTPPKADQPLAESGRE